MKEGWRQAILADVCEISSTLVDPREADFLDLPHIGAGNIEADAGTLVEVKTAREDQLISGKFLFHSQTVLYSKIRPYLRKVVRPDFNGLCSADIYPLTPKAGTIERDFLFHLLLSDQFTNYAIQGSARAGMPKVNREHLFAYTFLLPPLPEQRRIVAILDDAFEAIATAKASAEKNLRNAREICENQHQTIFWKIASGTKPIKLGDVAEFRNGINYTKQSRGQSVSIIGVKDFQSNFWAPIDDLDQVTVDGDLSELDGLAEGDIVTVRSNGNPELIGRCMVVGGIAEPTTHSGFTIKIRLNTPHAIPEYVCHFLRSREVRRQMISSGNGANIKSLNQGTLASISLPLPSRQDQQAAIDEINAITDSTSALADLSARKLAALDELKQSLLHQAFSGAL